MEPAIEIESCSAGYIQMNYATSDRLPILAAELTFTL